MINAYLHLVAAFALELTALPVETRISTNGNDKFPHYFQTLERCHNTPKPSPYCSKYDMEKSAYPQVDELIPEAMHPARIVYTVPNHKLFED